MTNIGVWHCVFILCLSVWNDVTSSIWTVELTCIQGFVSSLAGVQLLTIPNRPSIASSHGKDNPPLTNIELDAHVAPDDSDATLIQVEATGTVIELIT